MSIFGSRRMQICKKYLNQLKIFFTKHCEELPRPMFEINAEPTFFEHFLNISSIAYLEANKQPKHRVFYLCDTRLCTCSRVRSKLNLLGIRMRAPLTTRLPSCPRSRPRRPSEQPPGNSNSLLPPLPPHPPTATAAIP
jgi:hypothetical protein